MFDYNTRAELDAAYGEGYFDAVNAFAEKFLKKVHDNHYVLEDAINSKDYGMFTVGIEQEVNETKKEMVGEQR